MFQSLTRFLCAAALCAGALPLRQAVASTCDADPPCQVHLARALENQQRGNFDAALYEFKAAYARQPEPRLLLNIGRVLHKQGHYQEALKIYAQLPVAAIADASLARMLGQYKEEAQRLLPTASSPAPSPAQSAPRSTRVVVSPITVQVQTAPVMVSNHVVTRPSFVVNLQSPAEVKTDPKPTPIYRRWWLWTTVGAVLGASTGIVVGALSPQPYMPPPGTPVYPIGSALRGSGH